jgi:hypothetical protein
VAPRTLSTSARIVRWSRKPRAWGDRYSWSTQLPIRKSHSGIRMASLSRVRVRSAATTPSDHRAAFATGAQAATCKGGRPVAWVNVASAGKKPGQLK